MQIAYRYNAGGELTSRDQFGDPGEVTYSYDRNGSLTGSSDGLGIAYNAANHTTRISGRSDDPVTLAYAGSSQTERTTKGQISYRNGALGLAGETNAASATHYTRDPDGRLISLRRGGQSHYYLTDAIGPVLALIGPDGDVGARYSYEPFGQPKTTTGALNQPYRFAGEYYDIDTRLYKIGLRYYDPQTARWTQKDPIVGFADPRRTNRYIYAGQDPINNTDPTGAIFGIDTGDVVEAYSFVESAALTVGFGALAIGGTTTCAAATAGTLSIACAGIFLPAATTSAAAGYVTYQKGRKLLGAG